MEAVDERTATTPDAWPRGPQFYELPSGAVVKARKPCTFVWIKTGQVPDAMRAIMERIGDSGDVTMPERVELMDWYLSMCIMEPKVSLKKKAGHVCVDDIDDSDRTFLITKLGISVG